jgi:preprotein translocase subunit SecB
MAENATPTNGATAPAQLSVQKIYIRDASFEVPSAPAIFQEAGQPQVQLNLAQKVNRYNDDGLYEVVLTVTVTCKIADKTAYLAEVQQAGVFGLSGFDNDSLEAVLGTYCPHTLYPYARQAIADLVMQGGFPPFVLQPINFEQLYTEHRKRSGESAAIANA